MSAEEPQRPGGRLVIHRDSCPSTQDVIREAALAGALSGSIASADHQTAGRGRRGRTWTDAPATAVMLSYLARPRRPVAELAALPLVAGVAVCDALPAPVRLRWPNDVVVDGRKLAGILVELVTPAEGDPFAIVGVGINATMREEDLPATDRLPATSLLVATGEAVDRLALRDRVADELDAALDAFESDGLASARDRLAELDELVGRELVLRLPADEVRGVAAGVDDEGRLRLRLADGSTRAYAAGEVERVLD